MSGALLLLLAAADAGAIDAGRGPDGAVVVEAASPDAPTVAARLDRTEAKIGDVVVLTVTAITKRGVPVNLPAVIDLPPFAVLDRREIEQDLGDGRVRREFTLQIAAYEPGDLTVPPVGVTYLAGTGAVLTVKTSPLPLKIGSLLANEPEPKLKENAGPISVQQENLWPIYVACGLAAAGIGGLCALAIRRRLRRRREIRPAPPPRPPHEIALERLDRLGTEGFSDDADHRPFTFAVSEVIREYLGARYGFDSLEMTTDELVPMLRRRAGKGLILGEIEGWLVRCDLVKFAKHSPSASEARGTLETAIRIVESTRPPPEPPPTAEGPPPVAAPPGAGHA